MVVVAFLLLLSLLPPIALGCSCPPGPPPSDRETIKDDFCSSYNDLVYVGKVVGVTCTCSQSDQPSDQPFPPDEVFSCQSYSFDANDTEVLNYEITARSVFCARSLSDANLNIASCSQRNTDIANGITLNDVTQSLPDVVNNSADPDCVFACPFNNMTDQFDDFYYYVSAIQPCLYTLEIMELFKTNENYEVGDTIIDPGPDVLTSCGAYGRVLSAGDMFVVGIGQVCARIGRWSTVDNFGSDNLQYLREVTQDYQTDPSICGASTLAFLSSFLLFLTATITVTLL